MLFCLITCLEVNSACSSLHNEPVSMHRWKALFTSVVYTEHVHHIFQGNNFYAPLPYKQRCCMTIHMFDYTHKDKDWRWCTLISWVYSLMLWPLSCILLKWTTFGYAVTDVSRSQSKIIIFRQVSGITTLEMPIMTNYTLPFLVLSSHR